MPLPRFIARVNRRVTNRLLGGLAQRLPGFGVVVHRGRKSRRQYRTPVNIFRRGDRYIIALTYGSNADWVRNVLADGGCTLETRGRTCRLSSPRLFHDESRHVVPAPVRLILGLIDVSDFLELTLDKMAGDRSGLRGAGTDAKPPTGQRTLPPVAMACFGPRNNR
jgi:deazaflavin-dependent oxidoreductase (nitroreductase family)